ncbi:hypothetical protein NQ318_002399 [Aromia moschata]|uniref:PiggyBac transposable element-derived protein domain-containing protein n=1 Tax=Aromia moschata TaxID=1265417 RepID=A0AAV8YGG1_9CUCU|nr:hypothetical protein NQ318_002399 [Aromia moschata]
MFFDQELLTMIVNYSIKYARDKNRQDFEFNIPDLKRFLGIMIMSGYHILPQTDMYWSRDEDKGIDIIKESMSRNRHFQVSDNDTLDKDDKYAKLRPLFDAVNIRNKQFGIFRHNLAIDEQMVPYIGRHSCKMFIKGKPVRFGFKLCCLCSSDGHLFSFMPYAGANRKQEKQKSSVGLGGDVILELLSAVDEPSNYQSKNFCATGIIRENRTNHCPLESTKSLTKRGRGCYDSAGERSINLRLVKWNDNAIVTAASNNFSLSPLTSAKRIWKDFVRIILIRLIDGLRYKSIP